MSKRTVTWKKYGTCMDCGEPVLHRITKRCRTCHAQSVRGPRSSEPSRDAAHAAVKRALRRGDLVRPAACPRCGASDRRIEAHHHRGYGPEFHLDIVWVCTPCHQGSHRGKLTNAQLDTAVERHTTGETWQQIAADYGVNRRTIWIMLKRRTTIV